MRPFQSSGAKTVSTVRRRQVWRWQATSLWLASILFSGHLSSEVSFVCLASSYYALLKKLRLCHFLIGPVSVKGIINASD